ncbi:hypothetical protein V8C35DRAFT_83185 [Trichoderma chlorosporum]
MYFRLLLRLCEPHIGLETLTLNHTPLQPPLDGRPWFSISSPRQLSMPMHNGCCIRREPWPVLSCPWVALSMPVAPVSFDVNRSAEELGLTSTGPSATAPACLLHARRFPHDGSGLAKSPPSTSRHTFVVPPDCQLPSNPVDLFGSCLFSPVSLPVPHSAVLVLSVGGCEVNAGLLGRYNLKGDT